MGKSKHPGLLKVAQKDIVEVAKDVDIEVKAMKKVAAACAEAKKVCDSSPAGLTTQVKYMQGLIDKYTKKVGEIIEAERALDKAKGDRAAEAEAQKKVDKLEAEADALREQYNQACLAVQSIAEVAKTLGECVNDSVGTLIVFSVNGK